MLLKWISKILIYSQTSTTKNHKTLKSTNTKELKVSQFHPQTLSATNKTRSSPIARPRIIKTIWYCNSSHHQKQGHSTGTETSRVRSEQSATIIQAKIMLIRFSMEITRSSKALNTPFSISAENKGL